MTCLIECGTHGWEEVEFGIVLRCLSYVEEIGSVCIAERCTVVYRG
jgi:hypothetical protein